MDKSLQDILSAREQRAATQKLLLETYRKPLICFTMNIPGPEKTSALIEKGFRLGQELLLAQLNGEKITVLHQQQGCSAAGYEGYYVADCDPVMLKRLTLELEEQTSAGRLFDFDVLDARGQKWDRGRLGYPERKCLICGGSARVCGRSRAHSVSQLQDRVYQILTEALQQRYARRVAAAAVRGLLYEVCISPKPGLVDRFGNGSHKDMNIFTFLASAPALEPYFFDCVRIGQKTEGEKPEETFRRLRLQGKIAQQEMFRVTGGINAHKGAIFTLGLLCGAAGRLEEGETDPGKLLATCAAMTAGITEKDYRVLGSREGLTNGETLFRRYGITGVRGQAERGYPAIAEVGLPALERGLSLGYDWNRSGCGALLAIMASCQDTNLIHRGGLEESSRIRESIRSLLQTEPYPEESALRELDREFTQKNLSPGGSADLLAACCFLHFLKNEP